METCLSSKVRPAQPSKLDGFWYLRRRVPKDYQLVEPKPCVWLSTGIRISDDPRGVSARKRVLELDITLQAFWRDKHAGKNPKDPRQVLRAAERAKELGMDLLPKTEIRAMSFQAMFERLVAATGDADFSEAFALDPDKARRDTIIGLGTHQAVREETPPADPLKGLMVSKMVEEFERINATAIARKSPNQLKRWRKHRQAMVDVFIALNGGEDFPVITISKEHTHTFRDHWQKRVVAGEIKITSANRQMRRIAGLYKSIHAFYDLDSKNPFSRIRIPGGRDGKRLAYAPSFVQSRFLADGMFDDINAEARRIIFLIVETGIRISEACALNRDTIHLNGPIPYIEVSDESQETKTADSVRQIPLVGVALMAMKAQPNGFPRYWDNPTHCSNTINNALDVRKLKPGGKKQSLYSLRHTLIDRLKAVEAPKDIQEDMLGHVHMYGEGTTLEHRHAWLSKIAFTPPSRV
jgi:integrase